MMWAGADGEVLGTARVADAGAVPIWPLASVVRRPTLLRRLLVEAFSTTAAVIGLVWLAWIALWWLEQRW